MQIFMRGSLGGIGSEQTIQSSAESYHGRPGHDIVVSSLRVSPLLSTQLTWILSPGLPPANVNWRNGFFDTAGPHCADSTGRPLWRALTSRMKCAGTSLPSASLR